jgi:hypothetical protein
VHNHLSRSHSEGICRYFAKCFPFLAVILLGIHLRGDLWAEEQKNLSAKREKALRKTVDAFWGAWQHQDYAQAAQFVIPEQKAGFMRLHKFSVRGWNIENIEPGKAKNEVIVAVVVDRFEPFFTDYFKWRQIGIWIEIRKKWYLKLPGSL